VYTISQIIEHTEAWIRHVVIACNFCPFASSPFTNRRIHYEVNLSTELSHSSDAILDACKQLDDSPAIETSLLIIPNAYPVFEDYLDFVFLAETIMKRNGYESVYQLASFHPLYRFSNAGSSDAANYTNRSPYPMIHFLREEMVEIALMTYKNPEQIPERNVRFARDKGLDHMKLLRESCFEGS
jgi:uncharacterized protein